MNKLLIVLSYITVFAFGCLFMHYWERPITGSYEQEIYYNGYLDGMTNQIYNQGCDSCLKEGMQRDTAEFGDWMKELNQ